MAYLSQAPAAQGQRLFELLEEKQEPFLLDVYLVERGYEDRLPGSQSTCKVCWPGDACKRLRKLTSLCFRSWRDGVLSKLFCRKAVKNALQHWVNKAPGNNARSHNACFSSSIARELNGNLRLGRSYVELDSEHLSPVSVLELCSCEGSPVHRVRHTEENTSTVCFDLPSKVLHVFNELLEVAYTPSSYQLIGSKRQLDVHECLSHEMAEKAIHGDQIPPWKRQHNSPSTRQLIVSDLSCSGKEWSQFQLHQVREIGVEIEATLFEDIKEETILEEWCLLLALISEKQPQCPLNTF